MPAETCAFIKPNGSPCAARPLPGSDCCLFHDPAHQQALAQSRAKGGSAPRRRARRYPRLLDHLHVAELLGELFIDALNDPDAIDPKRLNALTGLSRTLLKAVGTPRTFLVHSDRREPAPEAGHLLRLYLPAAPHDEARPAVEPAPDPDTPPPAAPAGPPDVDLATLTVGDAEEWNVGAHLLPARQRPWWFPPPGPLALSRLIEAIASPDPRPAASLPPDQAPASAEPAAAPAPPAPPAREQNDRQGLNRSRTGPSSAAALPGSRIDAPLPSSPAPAGALRHLPLTSPDTPSGLRSTLQPLNVPPPNRTGTGNEQALQAQPMHALPPRLDPLPGRAAANGLHLPVNLSGGEP